jgi:hypothetical protein
MTNFNATTISVAAVATAYSSALTPRWQYLSVTNETGVEIFVRTDGQPATADGDFCTAIPAGSEPVVLANMLPLWDQAMAVVANGSANQSGQWKGGGTANPGTSVSVIAPAGTLAGTATVTIQGAG